MKNSKVIGLVLPNTPSYSETFFNSKIKGLIAQGFNVYVLIIHQNTNDFSFENTKVISIYSGTKFQIFTKFLSSFFNNLIYIHKALKLFNANRKDGHSLLKSFKKNIESGLYLPLKLDFLHFGYGTLALNYENIAYTINAKMAVSFRGFDWYIYPSKKPKCYATLFSKKVQYHVLSDEMKNSLILQGIDSQSITKITPAIDTSYFKTKKTQFNITSTKKIINFLTIGRLHWIKGYEYTLEALFLLKKTGITFNYTIVGEGREYERLKFATQQLNLTENVFFLGKLSPEEVRNQFIKADIYLQYSIQEGFCNAVLEAQAMGKICIVSDADGLAENVLDSITGFVVPRRNPELLCNKIIEVIYLNEENKKKLQEKTMQRIEDEFTMKLLIAKFKNFYNS